MDVPFFGLKKTMRKTWHLGDSAVAVNQIALQTGKEIVCHGVIVGIAKRPATTMRLNTFSTMAKYKNPDYVVAQGLGINRRTVYRWLSDYHDGGEAALAARPILGAVHSGQVAAAVQS